MHGPPVATGSPAARLAPHALMTATAHTSTTTTTLVTAAVVLDEARPTRGTVMTGASGESATTHHQCGAKVA